MTIKILTDGSTDIPQNLMDGLNIKYIPIHVKVGDKDYLERNNITTDELYETVHYFTDEVTTTQPTPGEFAKAFVDESEDAAGIICILTSSKFSKMAENAKNVANKLNWTCPIEIIDSKSVSSGTGLIVLETARYASTGKSFEEIVSYAKELTNKITVAMVLDDVQAIEKSGRLGKGSVFTKTMLDVKPVIEIKNGELSPIAQTRTRSKAIEKLNDIIKETDNIEEICVTYNTRPSEAIEFAKNITAIDASKVSVNRLNAGIGSHTGAGLIGIAIRTE